MSALLLSVAYLLYPAMQWSNVNEFHPDTFATPLLLAAFYFYEQKAWKSYFAMLVLTSLTKETIGLTALHDGYMMATSLPVIISLGPLLRL